MAKYFGSARAAKAYPKDSGSATIGLELTRDAALKMMLSLAKFLDSDAKDRLIITAYKSKVTKKGIPMTFIAGKNSK